MGDDDPSHHWPGGWRWQAKCWCRPFVHRPELAEHGLAPLVFHRPDPAALFTEYGEQGPEIDTSLTREEIDSLLEATIGSFRTAGGFKFRTGPFLPEDGGDRINDLLLFDPDGSPR